MRPKFSLDSIPPSIQYGFTAIYTNPLFLSNLASAAVSFSNASSSITGIECLYNISERNIFDAEKHPTAFN